MLSKIKRPLLRVIEPCRALGYHHGNDPVARASRKRIQELAEIHAGRRAVIIGNGPSINRQDLNRLAGEVTFACNSFFLKYRDLHFRPTYHVVEDKLVAEDNATELSALDCSQKIIPWDLRRWIRPDGHTAYVDFRRFYSSESGPDFPRFSFDARRPTYWGGTVLYLCIQLAAHMGCNPIVLIGVDLTYSIPKDIHQDGAKLTSISEDPNHFDPSYFGPGKRWHLPATDRMQICFRRAWEALAARKVELLNATDGGNLQEVPRIDFNRAFPGKTLADEA